MGMTSEYIPLPARAQAFSVKQEGRVVADVIVRIVMIRREHHQYGIRTVLVLHAPDHRRNVQTRRGIVEHELLPSLAVVRDDVAAPVDADKKLMQTLVRVLAANFLALDAEDQKI